mmetsp:Transcript_13299/g.29606  ORF Transcript_13299/g.29606 Transcript_13299/m.29606 type:complete len:102 (-) Transcript_13299:1758-2063(-)
MQHQGRLPRPNLLTKVEEADRTAEHEMIKLKTKDRIHSTAAVGRRLGVTLLEVVAVDRRRDITATNSSNRQREDPATIIPLRHLNTISRQDKDQRMLLLLR